MILYKTYLLTISSDKIMYNIFEKKPLFSKSLSKLIHQFKGNMTKNKDLNYVNSRVILNFYHVTYSWRKIWKNPLAWLTLQNWYKYTYCLFSPGGKILIPIKSNHNQRRNKHHHLQVKSLLNCKLGYTKKTPISESVFWDRRFLKGPVKYYHFFSRQ